MKKIFLSLMIGLIFLCFMMSRIMAEESVGSSVFNKYQILDCRTGIIVNSENFANDILLYDVIYGLEGHNRRVDHILKRDVSEWLIKNGKTILAHEHLRKNTGEQEALDLYRTGRIDYEKLCEMAPILYQYPSLKYFLELSPKFDVRFLAPNIPIPMPGESVPKDAITIKELRKKIMVSGYESLNDNEKLLLPKDGFKILCDDFFHNFLFGGGIGGHSNKNQDVIHIGYWVMNEVMARSILDFFEDPLSSGYKMFFGAGINHGIFKGGIRASVQARNPNLKQLTIIPYSDFQFNFNNKDQIDFAVKYELADYIFVLRQVDRGETEKFKKEVNDIVNEVGELIGLESRRPVECRIIGALEAEEILGDQYSQSIKGLYLNNVLYFIDRDEEMIDAENSAALIAHEGTHSLQDRYFDLKRLRKIENESSFDKANAISSLIEGHAVYAMLLYYDKDGKTPIWRMLDQPFFRKDGSMVDMENIMKYRYGGSFVKYLYEKGGWNLVYSVFAKRLPESTEQIMHPEKYLSQEKSPEIFINIPDGWTIGKKGVMGEINIVYTFLTKGIKEEEALRAAGGWNGDLYLEVYDEKKETMRVVWKTAWDSKDDLEDFFGVYIKATNNVLGESIEINSFRRAWVDENGHLLRMIENDGDFVTIMSEIHLKEKHRIE